MLCRMRRMVCLDGLRGVLACYVMLSHTLPFAPLPAWLLWLFQHGGAGVDVFFILSGLVIVQSLASFSLSAAAVPDRAGGADLSGVPGGVRLRRGGAAAGHRVRAYGVDRTRTARRATIWSGGWPNDWGMFIATHLTMTHGLFPDGVLPDVWVGFLGAAWSLSTEWQFYLLALLIGARLGLRPLAWLFLALAAASIAWQAVAPEPWQFSRAFLPNKAQYFALGIASAIMVRRRRQGPWCLPSRSSAPRWCCASPKAASTSCCRRWSGRRVWRRNCCVVHPLRGIREAEGHGSSRLPVREVTVEWPLRLLATTLRSRPLVWLGAVVVRHLSRQRAGAEAAGRGACAMLVQGDGSVVHRALDAGGGRVAGSRRMGLHEWIEVPALRHGRAMRAAAWRVTPPLRSAPDERPVARRAALAQRLRLIAGRRPTRRP